MIQLARVRTEAAVAAALRGKKRLAREVELLKLYRDYLRKGGGKSPAWKSSYWKSGKQQLRKEAAGKCAYCESPAETVAHCDVEHFRPKALYWWLAYCFDNHLYACQICNQSYKGDQFPVAPGASRMAEPAVTGATTTAQLATLVDSFAPDPVAIGVGLKLADFLAACVAETPGLIDPYNENPEPYFRWEADLTNKEIWLRPRSKSARHRFVFQSCQEVLGLNREELRRWRWTLAFKNLNDCRDILVELDKQGLTRGKARQIAANRIREMMAADQPYAGMVRYFVNTAWALNL